VSHSSTCNRLLAALTPDDYGHLKPTLERVPLAFGSVLFEADQPISHVIFPDSGAVSVMVDTAEGRIEISLIGREGFVGIPVLLGTDRAPYIFTVQAEGSGL
jgi:CRP-like cAMP-binding protein